MISGINLKETKEFICKGDTENPTTWIIGVLPTRIFRSLVNKANPDNANDLFHTAVRVGLKGFKNYQIDGKEIEFETEVDEFYKIDMLKSEIADSLPIKVINAISSEIMKISKLSDDEVKN